MIEPLEVACTVACPHADGTAVTIVHRGWERLGAKGPERRERNARAWAGLVPHFERACAAAAERA